MSSRSDLAPVGPLLTWSAIGLAVLYAGSQPVPTNDLHIYLAMGRWMAEHRALLETEIFTWTAQGTPFVNATWGFSLLAWLGERAVGIDGLRIFNALCAGLAVGLPVLAARSAGADGRAAALGALYAWWLLLQNTALRSQTWVYPLFGLLCWLAIRPRSTRLAFLGAFAIGIPWVNIHGSFPAGIVYLLALGVGALVDRDPAGARTPLVAAAGLALGTCIGPYGPGIWRYVVSNSALPQARHFGEWMPPDPTEMHGIRFFSAVAIWLWLLGRSRRRAPTSELLLLLGFGFLALRGKRFVSWFGLATAVPLVHRIDAVLPPPSGLPRPLVRAVTVLLAAVWAWALVRGTNLPDPPYRKETPLELVEVLDRELPRSGPPARIFNPPEYGGLLSFSLWPRLLTSGDIRAWVFDDEAWNTYLDISHAVPGWDERLDDAGVTWMLLWDNFHRDTLLPAARAHPGWEEVGSTETMALFRRVGAPGPG